MVTTDGRKDSIKHQHELDVASDVFSTKDLRDIVLDALGMKNNKGMPRGMKNGNKIKSVVAMDVPTGMKGAVRVITLT